jgi:hypothetical protein
MIEVDRWAEKYLLIEDVISMLQVINTENPVQYKDSELYVFNYRAINNWSHKDFKTFTLENLRDFHSNLSNIIF